MKSMIRLVSILGLSALTLGGCVSQDKYDALSAANQTSAARVEALNQEARSLESGINAKQQRIDELEGEVRQLAGIRDGLTGQISDIRSRADRIAGDLGNLKLSLLDPETDMALQALAAQYPDLITYDPIKGMLRFVSDLTFDSGSDVVKTQARQSLGRLAQILTSSASGNYDIEVEGHTDNVQPSRTANRFPTNRHLSLARAVSVEGVLRQSGVPSHRVKTSGWGEYRPVVQNNASGGTAQNRRVDIYILPPSGSGDVPPGSAGNAAPAQQPVRSAPAVTPQPRREEPPMK